MNSGLWGMSGPYPPDVSVAGIPNIFNQQQTFQTAPALASLTKGSVLFVGANGVVSQDNNNLFWDNTNKRFGLGTAAAPASPLDIHATTQSGTAFNFNHTQNQANSSDLGDTAYTIAVQVSLSSATNELIYTGIQFNETNNLTGGGHIQNLRGIALVHYSNAGTTTDSWDVLNIAVGNAGGTVTQMNGFHVGQLQGNKQNAFRTDNLGATNWVAYYEGTADPPTGTWGLYITDNLPSVFGGWIRQSQGRARVTADYTNATNTFSNVADLTISNLVSGRSYIGRFVLKCINSTAAEGIKFDFNGGSATMTNFWAAAYIGVSGGTDTLGAAISTSLAGVINWTTITGESTVIIDVAFTPSANGTLIIRSAENSAHVSGTVTIRLGSYTILEDSPN